MLSRWDVIKRLSHPTRRIVVAAALVILLCEVLARGIQPRLPEGDDWRDVWIQPKVKQMDDFHRQARFDVVFTGNSQMELAVDPKALDQEFDIRWSAYNSSLAGTTPPIQEHWLIKVVVPRLRPVTVMLGISPIDFVDQSDEDLDSYFQSLAIRSDWLGRFERQIGRLSTIVRQRRKLRRPGDVLKGSLATMRGIRAPAAIRSNSRGFTQQRDAQKFHNTRAHWSLVHHIAQHWTPVGQQRFAFDRTIRALQELNIEVLLFSMPVSSHMIEAMTRHARTYEDFRRFVRHEAEMLGVPLLDTATGLTDARLFRDSFHLNVAGSHVFTMLTGRILANGSPGNFVKSLDPQLKSRPIAPAVAADVLERALRKGA